ncbi:QueT transporter family protein [Listeria ivanovii]|uniref:QueT transporter family protein n=2 Tax=Listeria ivanovii TaxID=1638 RepID=UPI00209C271A|nr:QueT transporter family protein [Listeria ivanovii]
MVGLLNKYVNFDTSVDIWLSHPLIKVISKIVFYFIKEKKMYKTKSNYQVIELAQMALVTSLYIVVTLLLNPISYGAIQLRISETFNLLVVFDKKYIWSITMGVVISNLYSPLGVIDAFVGGGSSFFALALTFMITASIKRLIIKLIVASFIVSLTMFTVAAELKWVLGFPFLETYLFVGIGELFTMLLGTIIILAINSKVDLKRILSKK